MSTRIDAGSKTDCGPPLTMIAPASANVDTGASQGTMTDSASWRRTRDAMRWQY